MGLLDFLSPALTTATQAAGAYQGAQANAAVTQREAQMNALMMLRQQRELESQIALRSAQANQENTKATLNTREANTPRLGDDNYDSLVGGVEQAKALATLPTQIRLMVAKGQIDRDTALALARANYGYKLGELGTEYGYKGGLQQNQQQFELGKQQQGLTGQGANQQAAIRTQQSGQIIPSIVHGTKAAGQKLASLLTPSSGPQGVQTAGVTGGANAGASPQQTAWDQAAASLKATGGNPEMILGPRPE